MTPRWQALIWPCAALAWTLGLAAQLQQATLWSGWAYLTLAVLGGLLGWPGRWWRVPGMALLGWAMAGLHACAMPEPMDAALEGRDLDVVGRVQAMVQRQETGTRFRFVIEEARLDGRVVEVPRQVYLGWYSASSSDLTGQSPEDVQPGERWRLRVRLKAAHGHINPRGFDYELWLWEQGIRATGYVRQGKNDPPPQRLAQSGRHPVEWLRQQVRDRILERLRPVSAPEGVAGVIAALVTGDQAAIDRSAWDVFRATGVAHLMSISGLHVTLLGWLAARLLGALWRRSALWGRSWALHWPAPQVSGWGGLVVAAAYALFTGWGVPAQRTVWMLAVVTLLRSQARQWSAAQVWGVAGCVVLVLDPWALLQPGFWLSFVAVGVLMATGTSTEHRPTGTPLVHGVLHLAGAWRVALVHVRGLLREQWVVSLALAPLSLLFFGQLSLVGLLANLLAIPWVTLVVTPLALLGMLLPWCWDLAVWALQPLTVLLSHWSAWRWASVSLAMPPWPLAAVALLGALGLAWRGPWSWRMWGVPLMLPALLWLPPRPVYGQFELLAADVGQGNAVLLRTARHSLLYDAGPRNSPESDAGHRVLVPLLTQFNEKLDVLMLSHRDSDHTGGAPAVLAMQPQVIVWSSLDERHPLAQHPGHERCEAGRRWQWDGVRFEVLHPQPGTTSMRSNALSCVLRVQGDGGTALLVGDIEAAQERELLSQGLDPVDLLLVPHHGSKTSSSQAFLDALTPGLALVQAGYRNRFGHPAAEVVQRYQRRGVRLLTSVHCGAAFWRSDQPGQVRCERQAAPRYWRHVPPP